jgi:hypothetical protein
VALAALATAFFVIGRLDRGALLEPQGGAHARANLTAEVK